MEPHGRIPDQNIIAVIPARFGSTRLPGKLLMEIDGKPLISHTVAQVEKSGMVDRVIVATDDARIETVIKDLGGEVVITSPDHASGSDRVAEVAEKLMEGSIVVNVQGDEPLIDPATIDRVVAALIGSDDADIATAFEFFRSPEELFDPNNVKIALSQDGRALYFSRSPIPFPRDQVTDELGTLIEAVNAKPELLQMFKKHCGIYAFRREYLLRFARLPRAGLETVEALEQLRALGDGAVIVAVEAAGMSIGVDTLSDLDRVKEQIAGAKPGSVHA